MGAAFKFGFPTDAGACLSIELDGLEAGLDRQAERARDLHGERRAGGVERGDDGRADGPLDGAEESDRRRGRLAPSNCTQDGVIPRTKLPQVLREIAEIGRHHGLRICNVFHAGDGNLHPVILFHERDPEEVKRVLAAGSDILQACVDAGDTLTGEHGVSIEKIDHMRSLFSDTDLEVMQRIKNVFNSEGLCNPGKIFPTSKGYVEVMLKARSVALCPRQRDRAARLFAPRPPEIVGCPGSTVLLWGPMQQF